MKNLAKKVFIVLFIGWAYISVNKAYAATINLDTDFNGVGYVTHNNAAGGNSHDGGDSIAIQIERVGL